MEHVAGMKLVIVVMLKGTLLIPDTGLTIDERSEVFIVYFHRYIHARNDCAVADKFVCTQNEHMLEYFYFATWV